jgi:RNA polymerase sigma-70 factor, ECF subfamily
LIDRVVLAKAGDKEALAVLFTEIQDGLQKSSGIYLNEKMDREDAVQDTFEAICQKLSHLKNNACFRQWCSQILRSKCKEIRRKRRIKVIFPLEHYQQNLAAAKPYFTDRMRDLYDCMLQMDQGLRETMILRFFHELPVKAIAKILNIPEGTVRSRIHYGKLQIKNNYSLYQGD